MFYGVYGKNGFGVYDEYFWAKRQLDYLSRSNIKRFDEKDEALCWAIDGYNNYQFGNGSENSYYGSTDNIRMNWIYYRKDIDKLKMIDED